MGKGGKARRNAGEIRARLAGLARANAPATGRQARPDLIEIKSGKQKCAAGKAFSPIALKLLARHGR
ncbi:MAG: hypothetical protein AUK60_05320 [Rhodobacteraceae bacterium CG2_30_10_405]|nr:hypothetical protein [Rhodobacterales bacterium]OIQ06794.1 MAG: hypothetical protein AUK60_05320 [Rhodobacteraceae bacterium CG2_30_10_405]